MSLDAGRELHKIGRSLNGVDPNELGVRNVPTRTCFVVVAPRSKLDTSGYLDGLKAARMFIRADFRMFFLLAPEYTDFYRWYTFLLKNTSEYLAIVLTGFQMQSPDGGPGVGAPFVIKDREIYPSKLFKQLKKYKHPSSRLTFVINGCPAVESWSNGGTKTEKMKFSTTSLTFKQPSVQYFAEELPEKVLLITASPRLDTNVTDRAKSGSSNFITELSNIAKTDPVLSPAEVLDKIVPRLRPLGEEPVVYASSFDVDCHIPFLL